MCHSHACPGVVQEKFLLLFLCQSCHAPCAAIHVVLSSLLRNWVSKVRWEPRLLKLMFLIAEVALVSPWPVAEGSWIHHLDITTFRLTQRGSLSAQTNQPWCCCYVQIHKVIGVGRDSGGHSAQPPVKCFVLFVVNGWAVSPHWYVLREINNTLNVCGII